WVGCCMGSGRQLRCCSRCPASLKSRIGSLLISRIPRGGARLLVLGLRDSDRALMVWLGPPSQGWRTLLCNHASDIAAMDLFIVPTIGFDLLYALVIVRAMNWRARRSRVGCAPRFRP